MIGLSALFVTLQINSAGIVSAQNAKAPQDGFIGGCSVIDPLDERIQQRFSKADTIFGYARVATPTNLERGHKRFFQAETEKERAVIADMERSGLQVGFYLCGGDPHYNHEHPDGIQVFDGVFGPVVITPIAANWELPENVKVWKEAENALRSFKEKDQYEFIVEKWTVTARPIRARESCLECHRHQVSTLSPDTPEGYRRLKPGDVLGIVL